MELKYTNSKDEIVLASIQKLLEFFVQFFILKILKIEFENKSNIFIFYELAKITHKI